MRITEIREKTVSLASPMRNAGIGFGGMTATALVVVTDIMRGGRPVMGLAFDSVGRYAHGGLLRERFLPRLTTADPSEYVTDDGSTLDPFKVRAVVMRDEKPGGHGERPGAIGLIDAAIWDVVGKIEEKPLWRILAERFGDVARTGPIAVYASGGHYRDADDMALLRDELKRYCDLGYRRAKIKCGGLPLTQDLRRIEAAVGILGPDSLAVDCNGTMSAETARTLLDELAPFHLAWVEEPVDPLDFGLHAELARHAPMPLATGENLFSAADTLNLLRHGGLRSQCDLLQMDISLSYGVVEYMTIIAHMEAHGWSRRQCYPHAGHLLAFNVVAGLGLGCYEASPNPTNILGGLPGDVRVDHGMASLPDAPGVGIEAKSNLYAVFSTLVA